MHFFPGRSLSALGYHLCVVNKTRTVTFLAVHKVPFSVTKPCGGWLLWKTCTVTEYRLSHQTQYQTVTEQETSCCRGFVQVGRYCTPCECTYNTRLKNKSSNIKYKYYFVWQRFKQEWWSQHKARILSNYKWITSRIERMRVGHGLPRLAQMLPGSKSLCL